VSAGSNKLAPIDRRPEHDGNAFAGIQYISSSSVCSGDGVPLAASVCAQVAVSKSRDAASVFAAGVDCSGGSAARVGAVGGGGELPRILPVVVSGEEQLPAW